MRSLLLATAALCLGAMAGSAYGLTLDAGGHITDWGLTPFAAPNQADAQDGSHFYTIADNYAPIAYPGVGREPSPGLSRGGEVSDLEELHVRTVGGSLQVLVVASSSSFLASGERYYMGDLFLELSGVRYGVVTHEASQGLAAGSVYRIDDEGDFMALQPGSRSYYSWNNLYANDYGPKARVRDVAGPWAVDGDIDPDQLVGVAWLTSATFDYGGSEDGTWLCEYTFDRLALGWNGAIDGEAHIAYGCGNDVIEADFVAPHMPEPLTVVSVAFGTVAWAIALRRRMRAAPKA